MSEQVTVLVLEQRAWRGVRLCAKTHIPIRPTNKSEKSRWNWYVSIEYHYLRKQFVVDVAYDTEEYWTDNHGDMRRTVGTYGGPEFFAQTIDECIQWIEREFNVTVQIEGEKIAQEESWLREQREVKKR